MPPPTESLKKGMASAAKALDHIDPEAMTGKKKFMTMFLQIIVGLALAYGVYMLSLLAVNADKLSIDDKFDANKKQMVTIVDGYADSSTFSGDTGRFNTTMSTLADYVPIRPSANLRGGAQFTYSLWIYCGNYESNGLPNKTIFLKGDPKKYNFTIKDLATGATRDMYDRIAFCPMLKFGANDMEFTIFFNTFHNMYEKLEIKNYASSNNATRHNLLSLYNQKWVMLTISFEDNTPINDFESGVLVRVYVNDVLYHTGRFASALKQNNGSLCMFPDEGGAPSCRISNFVYFNYAASDEDIRRLANKGPSNKPVESVTKSFISPSIMSDYNRMDIYNT